MTVEEAGEYVITASYCGQCTGTKRVRAGAGEQLELEFHAYEDNWPLDDNPNPGGGKRMFPDNRLPSDVDSAETQAIRARVGVVARVIPAQAGVLVTFKVLDVDDAWTNNAPIDENHSDPNDNRDPESRDLVLTGTTDLQGIATVTFRASMKPGDNYRVAASTCATSLAAVTAELINQPGSTEPDEIPAGVYISPMLTVWRHLWIEQDSMALPTAAEYMYTSATPVLSVTPVPNGQQPPERAIVSLDVNLGDDLPESIRISWNKEHTLEGGTITFTGCSSGGTYTMFSNTDYVNDQDELIVVGVPPACAATGGYTLRDDDVPTWITYVPRSALPTTCGAYAEAYIDIQLLPQASQDSATIFSDVVGFELNLASQSYNGGQWSSQWDVQSTKSFWSHLIVHAFQPYVDEDMDPDNDRTFVMPIVPTPSAEDPTMGLTPAPEARSLVFVEVNRDNAAYVNIDGTLAHEMAHAVSADYALMHEQGGLMSNNPSLDIKKFAPATIVMLRNVEVW